MILGLDVSTTRIGWAVIDKDQSLIDSGFYKTDKNKTLEERAEDFRANVLEPLSIVHRVHEVRVEEPFSMFSGGKTTAKTMSSLQRFNGMISLLVHQLFGNPPTMFCKCLRSHQQWLVLVPQEHDVASKFREEPKQKR